MEQISLDLPVGQLPKGPRNQITDVPGVRVGHCTVDTPRHKTGVTVILPPDPNPYAEKLVAACHVVNGFGKTAGLMQIEELGSLESPIALTNTLNVGLVSDALVEYLVGLGREEGLAVQSVNPVVCECNDGGLSEIQVRAVGRAEVFAAIADARTDFQEGDVGAGKGTVCYGLKGGIGSASRLVSLDGTDYHLGVLVQTNFGRTADLLFCGRPIGVEIARRLRENAAPSDKGSIIMVLATDIPLTDRQLRRVCRRCAIGLARTGSYSGHGSGEVVVGFTTAGRQNFREARDLIPGLLLNEGRIDPLFRAAAECTEEAILHSLLAAGPVVGYRGNRQPCLRDFPDLLTFL